MARHKHYGHLWQGKTPRSSTSPTQLGTPGERKGEWKSALFTLEILGQENPSCDIASCFDTFASRQAKAQTRPGRISNTAQLSSSICPGGSLEGYETVCLVLTYEEEPLGYSLVFSPRAAVPAWIYALQAWGHDIENP